MLSALVLSLLALSPSAFAAPTESTSHQVEKRGFDGIGYGGGFNRGFGGYGSGFGGGYGFGGFGRDRFKKERFDKNKNRLLLAKERKNRFDLDRDTALAAKKYNEVNFAKENDRKFEDSKKNRFKDAEFAKKKDAANRIKFRKGGDFWKRQFDGDDFGFGGGDFGLDFDGASSDPQASEVSPVSDPSLQDSSTPQEVDVSSPEAQQYTPDNFFDSDDSSSAPSDDSSSPSTLQDDPSSATPSDDSSTPTVDDSSLDDDDSPPSSNTVTPDDSQASNDVQPQQVMKKRGFEGYGSGLGYGGGFGRGLGYSYGGGFGGYDHGLGGFGGFDRRKSFSKNSRFRDDKLARIAELENARRRKALERNRVKFNAKNFNELKFKNDLDKHASNKEKAVVAKDGKNLDFAKKEGFEGGFF